MPIFPTRWRLPFFALAFGISILGHTDVSEPTDPSVVRFMTFNFQNTYGGPEFGSTRFVGVNAAKSGIAPKPEASLKAIAEIINRSHPGILAAQEIESLQMARHFNQTYLGSRYLPILESGADRSHRNIAFFVDRSLPFEYELENHLEESWSPEGDGHSKRLFPRGVPTLLIFDRDAPAGATPRAIVISTHNRSKKNLFGKTASLMADPTGNLQRDAQMNRISEIIDQYRSRYGKNVPIVFMGDMNANPQDLPEGFLKKAALKNVHDAVTPPLNERDRATLVDATRRTMEYDRIYVSNSLRVARSAVNRFHDENGNDIPLNTRRESKRAFPSDHVPPEADVEIPPGASTGNSSGLPRNPAPVRLVPGRTAMIDQPIALAPTTPANFQDALKTKLNSELVIRLPTTIFQKETDLLSAIVPQLPMNFPEFDHSLIRQGFSSSIAQLGDLSIPEVSRFIQTMKSIHHETFSGPMIDPNNIRVVTYEKNGFGYLALEPSRALGEWEAATSKTLQAQLGRSFPDATFAGIGLSRGPNIPLLRWPLENGLSAKVVEEARQKLESLIRATASKLSSSGMDLPRVFDSSDNALELTGSSAGGTPRAIVSFRSSDTGFVPTPVMSWIAQHDLPDPETRSRWSLVELDTERLLSGGSSVQGSLPDRDFRIFSSLPRDTERVSPEDFAQGLPEPLRSEYLRESARLGTAFNPRVMKTADGLNGDLYLIHNHHPMLAPHKTEKVQALLEDIGAPRTPRVATGYAVYGSYARAEYDRPSDVDLLMNAYVQVPPGITSHQEAEEYAIRAFMDDVMGHFRTLSKAGKLSFIEGRIGSDATLKVGGITSNPLVPYNNNPYLSHQDIMSGTFVDRRTEKKYTLEDLIRLGDFTKFKLDYFHPNGTRDELSLQFVIGYEWNGNSYLLRRNGFKGAISSLLPTGVYFGRESYAVGTMLARNVGTYSTQFGDPVARSIGELIEVTHFKRNKPYITSDPAWRAKLFKRFYATLGFLQRNGRPGMGQVFFEDMMKFLSHSGAPAQTTVAEAIQHIVVAVNQPDLSEVNGMKRIAVDFRELNERNQLLTEPQWKARAEEFETWKVRLEKAFPEDRMPSKLKQAVQETERLISNARTQKNLDDVNAIIIETGKPQEPRSAHETFLNLENELTGLEGRLITDTSFSPSAIPRDSSELVRTMIALMPHLYARYCDTRMHLTRQDRRMVYLTMGVKPDEPAQHLMTQTSQDLPALTISELERRQAVIFGAGSQVIPPGQHCVLESVSTQLQL